MGFKGLRQEDKKFSPGGVIGIDKGGQGESQYFPSDPKYLMPAGTVGKHFVKISKQMQKNRKLV